MTDRLQSDRLVSPLLPSCLGIVVTNIQIRSLLAKLVAACHFYSAYLR